jgi:4-hydroxy-2-oxoheptanedioate aldolase
VKINTAKRRMLEGKAVLGAGATLGSPLAAEILSLAGFDLVLVDNQHGAWDDQGSMLAFHGICLGPAIPMARVRQNDFYAIGRLLDRGAMGIVVPFVNTVAEAKAAAYAVRYPPRGGRSMGTFGTAFLGDDYVRRIDDEVFLAVQIESVQAAAHAEEILAVDGVDGCWIGPADLANSMGVDLATAEGRQAHEATILGVLEACRKTGKIPGIAGGDDAGRWIERGFLFVTSVTDGGMVQRRSREILRDLRGG